MQHSADNRAWVLENNVILGEHPARIQIPLLKDKPSVTPDGEYLVYVSIGFKEFVRNGCGWWREEDGGCVEWHHVQLVTGWWLDRFCLQPGTAYYQLYLIHPNGTGLRKLIENGSGKKSNHPCFIPDVKNIAFATDYAGISAEPISNPDNALPYGEIFTVGLDGTPAWSHNYIYPINVQRQNGGPYCSFDDCYFLNKMPNSTRVAVSKPHSALQWNFAWFFFFMLYYLGSQ